MKFSYGQPFQSQSNTSDIQSELLSKSVKLKEHISCTQGMHPEDFLSVAYQGADSTLAYDVMQRVSMSHEWVFIVGIGGANLGTEAVYDALRESSGTNTKKALFFDAIDDIKFKTFEGIVTSMHSKDSFVLMVISKSGKTLETLANAHMVSKKLEDTFGDIADRTIILTKQDSPLWNETSQDAHKIALQDSFSDRYSVFSSIGLIPLALLGFNIELFLGGAKKVLDEFDNDGKQYIDSAMFVHTEYVAEKMIRDYFFFIPELETLGKWTRQLVAESLGKDGKGILPTVSIGTTDLHSMAQLYFAGDNNRMTSFVIVENKSAMSIPESHIIQGDEVQGKDTSHVQNAIYESVKESYRNHNLDYQEITLSSMSEESIAEYMMSMMIETVLLAYVWEVNAFNQPEVEDYKTKAHDELRS